jgi:hypothetical protein
LAINWLETRNRHVVGERRTEFCPTPGLQRKIKIANLSRRPSLSDERAPTKEELRRVLYGDKTLLRTRACIALVAFAGVRLEVLGDFLGNDGLKLSDFPELGIKGKTVDFLKIPTMIMVREELNKSRHRYLTFLAEEGCEVLKQYLEARMREARPGVRPDRHLPPPSCQS